VARVGATSAPRPRAGAVRAADGVSAGGGADGAAEDDPAQEAGMRSDLVVGGHLPDLELPDHRREPVRLSARRRVPLIVSFYRGYW
jgi:hypothetical protein